MIPKDNIYDVILTYKLPISREQLPIEKFLASYFGRYINSLQRALQNPEHRLLRQECYDLLTDKMPVIIELCKDIIEVFEHYDTANMKLLYRHFDELMKKIEPYLRIERIGKNGPESLKSFYRIRAGKEKFSRLDMFHIPMNKRHLIKSYRYSIPGYPSLYLSTGRELCWFECGMPKEFSYSSFELSLSDVDAVKFINFSIIPTDLIFAHLSYQNREMDAKLIDNFIVKYLITLPLRAACSIEVSNKDASFIEEYVFPQQLLLWIREHKHFDGIAYRTSSAIERAQDWNYINIVMPATELENGYCKNLARLFVVSEPVQVEIRNIIKNYETNIQKVREFSDLLERKYYHGYSLYPYREILSLCKTFLLLSNLLTLDSYKNAEAIYQTMDTLNLLSNLITDNIDSIKERAIEKAKESWGLGDEVVLQELTATMRDFSTHVKPALFELWSYVFAIRKHAPIDPTSYQHVL